MTWEKKGNYPGKAGIAKTKKKIRRIRDIKSGIRKKPKK